MKTNRILTMAQAISEAMSQEMTRNAEVFVTHDPLLSALCDRTIHVVDGQVQKA